MHLLARRACIEITLCFQFTGKIQGELTVLVKTAQHQNLRVELVLKRLHCPQLPEA